MKKIPVITGRIEGTTDRYIVLVEDIEANDGSSFYYWRRGIEAITCEMQFGRDGRGLGDSLLSKRIGDFEIQNVPKGGYTILRNVNLVPLDRKETSKFKREFKDILGQEPFYGC